MGHFVVVDRGSETQPQVCGNLNKFTSKGLSDLCGKCTMCHTHADWLTYSSDLLYGKCTVYYTHEDWLTCLSDLYGKCTGWLLTLVAMN